MKNSRNQKGFSLVELIVVVAIMAVLVGVLAPAYLRYVDKTRLQKDISAIGEVVQAVKVAGAKEEVADEIPDAAKDMWDTTVTISGNNGARGASKLGTLVATTTTASVEADDLQKELNEVIGTVPLNHSVLSERGVELTVVRDTDYKIVVTVETYKYKDKPDVKKALEEAFGAYAALDLVSKDLKDSADVVYGEEYTKKYTEVYNKCLEEGKTAVEAAKEAAYEATKFLKTIEISTKAYNEAYEASSALEKKMGIAALKAAKAAKDAVEAKEQEIEDTANSAAAEAESTANSLNHSAADLTATTLAKYTAKEAAVQDVLTQCENNPEMKASIEKAAAREGLTLEEYVRKELLEYE